MSSSNELSKITHWKDNAEFLGVGTETLPVFCPATGEQINNVLSANKPDVDDIVASSKQAAEIWSNTSITSRTNIVFAFRHLLEENKGEIAKTISLEHGKVIPDALGEIQRGLEVVDFACGIGEITKGSLSFNVSTNVDVMSIRFPLGVIAGITPFNFPAMVPLWMHPIAIACGNTFILKPSEKDPSASMEIAKLWKQAGLPDGVLNIVHGSAYVVNSLLEHKDIDGISFVGSTPVAKHIYETSISNKKRCQALGGAKNHMVVLGDANIEAVADAAVSAGFGSAGERCMAVSVLVVLDCIADEVISKIKSRASKIVVGPSDDPDTEMGPVISRQHCDKITELINSGVESGADLILDGRDLSIDGYENGFYVGPTIFDRVTTEMPIYKEEIFGPVLNIIRVNTFDEAIELVKSNPYGNG
ncbi:MAG TPA: CoA-acylating methylmalonate-semialdehyde dehydrogenase, partial [Acidimicrobiia bacterium]|nr:CoA-acylating methylmalonate-semialdehyde dehydrogenase [Acidimicrobiia bacterium]